MKIIGLAGPAGCGKDTVGEHLWRKHAFAKVSFADPIRLGICAIFNWEPDLFLDRKWKETVIPDIGKSPRQLMQTLGTEWGRECVHPDLWTKLVVREIDACYSHTHGPAGVVITDVRFANEAQVIRDLGGQIWHIRRNVERVVEHVSENGFDEHSLDRILQNRGTLEQLYERVDEFVARV